MNAQPQASIWQRSSIFRFFRSLSTWPGIRRVLIIVAWAVSIVALFYGGVNWSARHAWNKYRQELEARGEQFDFQAFIPKPVPDDQNFAATPFVKSWFDTNSVNWAQKDNYSKIWDKVVWLRGEKRGYGQFADLVACRQAFDALQAGKLDPNQKIDSNKLDRDSRAAAAPAVLQGLADDETYFAELRAASQRPFSRYPVVYDLENPWVILLPHLWNVRAVWPRLELKACAELAVGKSDLALADVKLMVYLADSVKAEPILISYLVRAASLSFAVQCIWEGLAEHAWSDAQLQEIQALMQNHDFVGDLRLPLGSEQAAGILTINLLRKNGLSYLNILDRSEHAIPTIPTIPTDGGFAPLFRFVPNGWYDREELNYCRLLHVLVGAELDQTSAQISPGQVESRGRQFEKEMTKPGSKLLNHRLIASLLLPALRGVPFKAAVAQTRVNQVVLACALERFRLGNGQFPESLDALVPKYLSRLPHDVITGGPYKYRRTTDGEFVLYSVGWNEADDGGVVALTKGGSQDWYQGDWVWQMPSK